MKPLAVSNLLVCVNGGPFTQDRNSQQKQTHVVMDSDDEDAVAAEKLLVDTLENTRKWRKRNMCRKSNVVGIYLYVYLCFEWQTYRYIHELLDHLFSITRISSVLFYFYLSMQAKN
jgi:hypothetical protein